MTTTNKRHFHLNYKYKAIITTGVGRQPEHKEGYFFTKDDFKNLNLNLETKSVRLT